MANCNHWWREEDKRPILIICETNHVLDQFLEAVVESCKLASGFMRFGGGSNSETIKKITQNKKKKFMPLIESLIKEKKHEINDLKAKLYDLA